MTFICTFTILWPIKPNFKKPQLMILRELVDLGINTWTRIWVWSHVLVVAHLVVMVAGHHGRGRRMEQLSRWKFLVVFVIVEIECRRRQVFVSSKQTAVSTMDPHMSIEISRLWEAKQTEFALIRFFAAVEEKKLSSKLHETRCVLPVNPQMLC